MIRHVVYALILNAKAAGNRHISINAKFAILAITRTGIELVWPVMMPIVIPALIVALVNARSVRLAILQLKETLVHHVTTLDVLLALILANARLIIISRMINVSHVLKEHPLLLDPLVPVLVNAQLILISRIINVLRVIKGSPRLLDLPVLMHAKKEMGVIFHQSLEESV